MSKFVVATLAALVGAAILAGCSQSPAAAPTTSQSTSAPQKSKQNLTVSVDFTDTYYVGGPPNSGIISPTAGNPCQYSGPDAGGQLAVQDGAGATIGAANASSTIGTMSPSADGCVLTYVVGPVPAESEYGLSYAGAAPVYYSSAQMAASDWSVTMSYGPSAGS